MRFTLKFPALAGLLFLLSLTLSAPAQVGYYFGQNKVKYKDFDWAVFQTDHFDVHYYPEIEESARDAARMAERGYAYLSQTLGWKIKDRVPLILYGSHNDFQQTNVVGGILEQGTRGVTEGLKNRVTLPLTGSYREFNHVLVHELVHAFQYDMMLGDSLRNNRFNPPLWLVEGMAEYLSAGMDNTTRMWVRDGLHQDKLLSVKDLNTTYDIRVYRLGQALWEYIGATYGKGKVGPIFRTAIVTGDLEKAFKSQIGVDFKTLTDNWHQYARDNDLPSDSTLIYTQSDSLLEQLSQHRSFFHRVNIVPSLSPDGNRIAFIANKGFQDELMLLTRNADGSYRSESLLKAGSGRQFEALRFFDTGLGWSPDGKQLALVSKSGANDAIDILDVDSKKVVKNYVFEEFGSMLSPTFSPDGQQLAFVGILGGISDLYVLNLETGQKRRLTADKYTELHPQWSPVDERILFVTDRGPDADPERLLFSDYDVAILNPVTNDIQMVTNLRGDVTSPQWGPDGQEIAYISEHQGIPNLYRQHLDSGERMPLTRFANGVSGITNTTPAFSWSRNGREMAFSAFQNTSWQLFRLDPADSLREAAHQLVSTQEDLPLPGSAGDSTLTASAWLPANADPNALYAQYQLAPEDSVVEKDYRSRFKLDGVAIGGGYNTFYGIAGGATMLFTDMLGNHSLYFSSQLQFQNPLHANASLTYFNQANRTNWGIQAFNLSDQYLYGFSGNQLGFIRNTYRGFNGLVAYPFSRFARVELSGGLTWIDQDEVVETYSYFNFDRKANDIATYNYSQGGLALVYDNATYGFLGPNGGFRTRFGVDRTLGDFVQTNFSADLRRYWGLGSRSVVAWRVMGGASFGDNRQYFQVAGPYGYRGADEYAMFGPKFFVSNLEYRFPLVPFLPPQADFISGAAFVDAAGAWGASVPG
ncbi:MAG TPA: peptidase MA family metallohydrolase, partial [Calditrichia bacterium]|nr:peptidase MA family metallohydrolase [Calditrichia bacterium]